MGESQVRNARRARYDGKTAEDRREKVLAILKSAKASGVTMSRTAICKRAGVSTQTVSEVAEENDLLDVLTVGRAYS